jgi:hypothetical protein
MRNQAKHTDCLRLASSALWRSTNQHKKS